MQLLFAEVPSQDWLLADHPTRSRLEDMFEKFERGKG